MKIVMLGIDLGKNLCSLAGLDQMGAVVLRRRLKRESLLRFTAQLDVCTVAMEACCGAHHLGRQIAEQVNVMSGHLSTATMHLSESAALIKEEVRGLTVLVDDTAEMAKEKVELVSRAIDTTHERVATTTEFIQRKVIEPARELAAILAGVRRGLEVLVAPSPTTIDRSYGDDEMFIG